MLGKRAMQTARKPQFELPGIFLQAIRLMDLDSLFQRCFQPCFFCVLCICDRAFDRFAEGKKPHQVVEKPKYMWLSGLDLLQVDDSVHLPVDASRFVNVGER